MQQLVERDDAGVERDLHDLGMTGAAGAHVLVRRVGHVAPRVAGPYLLDALQLLKRGFEAPEAPAGEGRDFALWHRLFSWWGYLKASSASAQLPRRQRGAGDARADLGECRVPIRRCVVREGRETAIVGRPQPVERDVLRRLQHAVPHLLRCLDLWIDRIDHADENPLTRLGVLLDQAQRPATIRLTGALDVEVGRLELEQRRQRPGVDHARRAAADAVLARGDLYIQPERQ